VFDIGCIHSKDMEWKERKGRGVGGLLLKDGMGRGGKGEERGREERKEKSWGGACPTNKKIAAAPLASKHQFGCPGKILQTS